MLGVSYCDRPMCVVRRPQFASNDISATIGQISAKVDRIVPLAVLYKNCSNCTAKLHKMAARAKTRKTCTSPPRPVAQFQNNFTEMFLGDPLPKLLK